METVYKAALFDLDGTLINSEDLILTSAMHAMSEVLGIEGNRSDFAQFVGIPLAVHLRQIAEVYFSHRLSFKGKKAEDIDELRDQLLASYSSYCGEARPQLLKSYTGINELAEMLEGRNIPRGIVTSKRRVPAITDLGIFGLDTYFPVVVAADDLDKHKPDPEPLLYGMNLVGQKYKVELEPKDCLYIGDSVFDLRAAHAAGMDSIAVTYGLFEQKILEKEKPHYIVENPNELIRILKHKLV